MHHSTTTITPPVDATDLEGCLEEHRGDCRGSVEFRPSLTGTGLAIARCDKHWVSRLDRQAEIDEAYPDSPIPPAWFDPTIAGERWDDDY